MCPRRWVRVVAWVALAVLAGCGSVPKSEMQLADAAVAKAHEQMRAGDWRGARAAAAAVGLHVRAGVVARPERRVGGIVPVDTKPLLEAFERSGHPVWAGAVGTGSEGAVMVAARVMRGHCVACHAMIGRPMIEMGSLDWR
jgi:hypothetical protein